MLRLFDRLRAGTPPPEASRDERLRLAATALLFRAVYVDDTPDPREIESIRRIVCSEFGLADDEADHLMQEAATAAVEGADLYGWTRLINAEYSYDEKCFLMQKLWQVVLADGVIDAHESALMRRLAGLIHVADRDNAHARKQAMLDS